MQIVGRVAGAWTIQAPPDGGHIPTVENMLDVMKCSQTFISAWKRVGWVPCFDFKIDYDQEDPKLAVEGGIAPLGAKQGGVAPGGRRRVNAASTD